MAPRFIAKQLAFPKGILGRTIGVLMNHHNARMNEFAVRQIAARSSEKILEIGFGGGPVLSRLIDMSNYFVGIDRSSEMVRQAQSRFRSAIKDGRADFHLGQVEALHCKDAIFNSVLSVNTVYFWKSLESGFSEIRRVLVPGGQAIVGFLPKEPMSRNNLPEEVFTLRTIDDVKAATRMAGFSETSVKRPGPETEWAVIVAQN